MSQPPGARSLKAGHERPDAPAPSAGSTARAARPARRQLEPAAGAGTSTESGSETTRRAKPGPAAGGPSGAAVKRRRRPGRVVPEEVGDELRAIGGAKLAGNLVPKLAEAARAYEHDRYREALTMLRTLSALAPESPSVRELHGLTLYRLGRWKDALRELQTAHELSGSYDQHPVMADCERALGRHQRVEALWTELRQAGVSSDLLAEGRLVEAGSLADRDEVPRAIALLSPAASRPVRRPEDRHVRQWYALADLYERVGDLPRARDLFSRVVRSDPELSDAAERLAALR
jgi:tetratricopeptide (TPR) repeat protein